MNKRFQGRVAALALAGWLAVSPALPAVRAAQVSRSNQTEDTVIIATEEDFLQFAKHCSLDTWSQGKTVTLTADLDLSGRDFAPIPTFGGIFLGQGHTVSGLNLTGPGSVQGLFRYVQPSGQVRDLNVQGTVAPEGTRSTVGGIAGDNAGTLDNCAFSGTVRGESAVGGIAGRNSETGQIIGCTAQGSVTGESATGGIAGRSLGLLLKCENRAGINLTQTETPVDFMEAEADAEAALEDRGASEEEGRRLLNSCSDTGGVAGFSGGVIQSCVNRGDVGYPHVGYNTGGIAGRQSGYLSGCVNSGVIHGRKDVGGIVGQAEPYLLAEPGQDTLERLRGELNTLERLIDRALDHAQNTGDDVSARLESMGALAGDARDSSRDLLDRISGFTDENIGTVNALAADLTGALDRISPALEDLSDAGGQLERLSGRLEDALEGMDGAADTGDQVTGRLRAAARELQSARTELSAAVSGLRQALEALYQTVFPPEGGGPVRPSQEALEQARQALRQAYDRLQGAGEGLGKALTRLQEALESAGPLSGQLKGILEDLQGAAGSSSAIGRLLRRAFDAAGDAVEDLTRDGPVEFTPLGEDFRQASDGLFGALSGLSGEMEDLRTAVQSGGNTLSGDLRAVNRQFHIVLEIFLDALGDVQNAASEGPDPMIQDTSDEDVSATREGKLDACRNTGAVEGDRNVGGVAGAMSIELDLDPEDDRKDLFSFGSTYETKAVLQDCLNYGSVTAKKDCVGGLAGRMDLGTALDCQNYGPVSSTGGDYVGGAAGWADASVRSCYAKCALAGKNYIGGVAGWASRLRDCCAIASITEGSEGLGAIAGGVETNGVLRNNRFVDTGVAGVDGVSYAGRAEPVPFDQLAQLEEVPQEFLGFTLTLVAQGETAAQIPFLYGEDLSRIQLPPVPEEEGCYGRWPDFDVSGLSSDITVEAVYTPWVTVTASPETSGKLSLALAEGRFTREAVLHVTDSDQAPPQEAGSEAAVWDVSLTGSQLGAGDPVPLRLLSPGGGEADVWQYREGQWRRTEAVRNGQYLLLDMEGVQGTFCLQARSGIPWGIPAAAAAGAAALAVLLLLVRRRWKKRRAAGTQKASKAESGAGAPSGPS